MNNITAPVTSSVASAPLVSSDRLFRTALMNLTLAGTAVLCVLVSKPGHANEGIDSASAVGASALRVQANGGEGIRVPTTAFSVASADLDGLRRQAAFVSLPMAIEGINRKHGEPMEPEGRRETAEASSSTIVEPVTIAVLGFTAAALIALRRKKNESASPEAISE